MYKLGFNTMRKAQGTYLWALYPIRTLSNNYGVIIIANGKDGVKQREHFHKMVIAKFNVYI